MVQTVSYFHKNMRNGKTPQKLTEIRTVDHIWLIWVSIRKKSILKCVLIFCVWVQLTENVCVSRSSRGNRQPLRLLVGITRCKKSKLKKDIFHTTQLLFENPYIFFINMHSKYQFILVENVKNYLKLLFVVFPPAINHNHPITRISWYMSTTSTGRGEVAWLYPPNNKISMMLSPV